MFEFIAQWIRLRLPAFICALHSEALGSNPMHNSWHVIVDLFISHYLFDIVN